MSIFSSGSEASGGSLGIVPPVPCPPLPNFLAEWAAIIPLVCHLATQRDDYITTGDIALLGRLHIGLFPRLGTLSGISRLLGRGSKFLDYASTKGGSSRMVWDVKWGSVFPCANGAASAAITSYLKSRDQCPPQRMPETLVTKPQENDPESSSGQNSCDIEQGDPAVQPENLDIRNEAPRTDEDFIRRYQLLHIYRFYRKPKGNSLRQRFDRVRMFKAYRISSFVLQTCLAVFLLTFGCFGTATILVCASVSELIAQGIPLRRPSTYLTSTENHDACMLVASHQNATEWHLCIGDRAVVDTMFNKPMVVVPEGRKARLLARWFEFANLLQFAAMTFVAGQKGWDGVCLVAFLGIHWALHWILRGPHLPHDWLEREGVEADVKSYKFGGRTAMIGAIQVFSDTNIVCWMDQIMVPHPRREAWLGRLRGRELTGEFNTHDMTWIKLASEASLAAAEVLKRECGAPSDGV